MATQQEIDQKAAELDNKIAQLNQVLANPAPSAAAGFGQLGGSLQAPQAFSPGGISLRLKIVLPNGSEISPYLHFGPEHCQTADAILGLVQTLTNMGIPIDTYTPRNQQQGGWGGNNGGGGGYGRGGGYGGSGGYNRGGGGGWGR